MERRRGLVFWLSIGWLALVAGLALAAPWLPIRDPDSLGIRTTEVAKFESPGWNAWFGGDGQGRDVLSNMIWGARPALTLAALVTGFAGLVGAALGVAGAYLKGNVDRTVMFIVDVLLAFPALILLAAITGTLGRDLWVLALALMLVSIPAYTRIVRGTTLGVATRGFIEAARSLGASPARVIRREVVPNILLPLASFGCLGFALVIATEGSLAFLNLSVQQTTWGSLIADGSREIDDASHLALIPATALFLTVLSLNFVGESMRGTGGSDRPRPIDPVDLPAAVPAASRRADPDTGSLLAVRHLTTSIPTPSGPVTAVADVSLDLAPGRSLGLIGESGSGKTMLLRSILGTLPVPGTVCTGNVWFGKVDLLSSTGRARRQLLGSEIGVVSQNPMTALNPVRTVQAQLTEPMRVHRGLSKKAARHRAAELLDEVGIPHPARRLRQYPHELSGGMRQRVTIAIALANEPRLLLADEPTTALDVTVQHQILSLLHHLAADRNMAMLLVTHDQGVIRDWADDVAVMYAAQIVEYGPAAEVLADPRHRYTRALLEAVPHIELAPHTRLANIPGQPPSLLDPPMGCRFADRCHHTEPDCRTAAPDLVDSDIQRGHRCLHPGSGPVSIETALTDGR